MDFKLTGYKELVTALINQKRSFLRFSELIHSYAQQNGKSSVTLRHDVDRLPGNALQMAQLEADLGIRGTYYFRIVPESFDPQIIEQIAELGHEVGYHYEDVDLVVKGQTANGRGQRSEVRGQK